MSDELKLTDWQRNLADKVAAAIQRGERVDLSLSRIVERRRVRAMVDEQMRAAGWEVLAPGVYRQPTGREESDA